MEDSAKKVSMFGQIEDVISIGALLRPTITQAVSELKNSELKLFREFVIAAEKELANSRLIFRDRFVRAQEKLRATFIYAPAWRVIATRIEEVWKDVPTLTVKELSVVSLILGMMLEETENRLSASTFKKTKRSA